MSSVYRTHTCGQLRPEHVGQEARLSGWVQRKRDHGNLLFIDLRDHYGVTQVVVDASSAVFKAAESVRNESVVTVTGKVVAREPSTVNARLATGAVELDAAEFVIQSMADPLPIPVYQENDTTPEELRLKYRFLDLRKDKLHKNIMLRAQVIASLRPHDRPGLHRVPDPDPDGRQSRGRAILPGAEPAPSRQILRAAAGAADVQAAADGVGLRPLFPDRALLPR